MEAEVDWDKEVHIASNNGARKCSKHLCAYWTGDLRLSEDKFMDLPEVFTPKTIPVSKYNVLNPEDIRKWRYLDDVKIPNTGSC